MPRLPGHARVKSAICTSRVRESEEEMGAFGKIMIEWVCLLAILAMILLLFKLVGRIKDRREGKRIDKLNAREAMLRTLPQLNFEDFRQVVEKLGWVIINELTGEYEIVLPSNDFASMAKVG